MKSQRNSGLLRVSIRKLAKYRVCSLVYTHPTYPGKHIHFYSDKRIDLFVNLTITLVGLVMVMLIVPIWVLSYTHHKAVKLAYHCVYPLLPVSCVLLLLMQSSMSLWEQQQRKFPDVHRGVSVTDSTRYCTVLMVFLQLSS